MATLSTLPGRAAAQAPVRLETGDRIRVVSALLPDGATIGHLQAVTKDTLILINASPGWVELPLSEIGQLHVSRGRDPAMVYGGIALGAIAGAIVVPAMASEDPACELGFTDVADCSQETSDVIVGAAGGAILMKLMTQALLPERWARVPIDQLLAITLTNPDRITLAFLLRF